MVKANKAAARLQALWDKKRPGDLRTIKKVYGPPKSSGSAGLTWAAVGADGRWIDLGYTEKDARLWIGGHARLAALLDKKG